MIASITFGFAVYVVLWWLVLFMVLPWGVQSQAERGKTVRGSERGAPVKPLMLKKIVATSVIAAVLLAIGYGLWYGGFVESYIVPKYAADRAG
jgi:predicted secreted protein